MTPPLESSPDNQSSEVRKRTHDIIGNPTSNYVIDSEEEVDPDAEDSGYRSNVGKTRSPGKRRTIRYKQMNIPASSSIPESFKRTRRR